MPLKKLDYYFNFNYSGIFMADTNNVSLFSRSTDTQGANLGGVKSPGHKKRENLFINSFIGSSKGGVAYVKNTTRSTISEQGKISSGTLDSDIAVEGSGMLLVSKGAEGEKVFTRRGDFSKDKNGYWTNGGGMSLLAWKLDKDGKLPANSTLLTSLEAVNFANVKGTPIATTTVSLAMNLDGRETTEAIRGAGFTAGLKTAGLNKTTGKNNKNDIILPEQLINSGGIRLGDSLTLKSEPNGTVKTMTYGGIAVSNLASNTNAIYGARRASDTFAQGAAPGAIPEGSTLTINGTTFNYKLGNPDPAKKEFNSFATLAAAINRTTDLTARVSDNGLGRLYIAPKDPNGALTFVGGNGGQDIPANLGLFNVAAGVNRFYSLETLEKAVNTDSEASLKATIDSGTIKITSKLATSALTLTGESFGVRDFTTVIRGDGTEKGRASIRILSPDHGLTTGDLVKITGFAGQVPNGIYAVGRTFGNNGQDSFEIFVLSDNPSAAPGATVADGFPAAVIAPPLATLNPGTWQKIPGKKFNPVPLAAGAAALNANIIRITDAANTVADNDIVYIKDFGMVNHAGQNLSVPDGYYTVSNRAAGFFDIIPAYNGGNPGASAVPAGPFGALGNFSYQKVGFQAAVGYVANPFNANAMVTTGGAGSNQVKLFTSDTTYSVNDFVSFSNLPNAFVVDNIALTNDTKYKVVATGAGFITFEVIGGAATNGDDATNPADLLALGAGFNVNNISQTLKYLNIPQTNTGDLLTNYAEVYVPTDPTKSLKALLDSNTLPTESTLLTEIDVFDSLGDMFALQFRFAKLDTNKWAVSVGLKPNADGIYADAALGTDGQINYGIIEFDQNGNYIAGTGISDVLRISRNNGSATSTITIDWANQLNEKTTATMSQFANPNNVEPSQQNGRGSGTLLDNGLSVDSEGFIIGQFDNGEIVKLYQIPIAMFANINGLLEGNDGTYRATNESGQAFLKAAGKGGAGQLIGRAIEESNTDTTDELLEVQDLANVIRSNARVASVKFSNIASILSELKQ